MKKTYSKPILKSTELLLAEQLLANSGSESVTIGNDSQTVYVSTALSNQESEHDIWGDDSSSMWK